MLVIDKVPDIKENPSCCAAPLLDRPLCRGQPAPARCRGDFSLHALGVVSGVHGTIRDRLLALWRARLGTI